MNFFEIKLVRLFIRGEKKAFSQQEKRCDFHRVWASRLENLRRKKKRWSRGMNHLVIWTERICRLKESPVIFSRKISFSYPPPFPWSLRIASGSRRRVSIERFFSGVKNAFGEGMKLKPFGGCPNTDFFRNRPRCPKFKAGEINSRTEAIFSSLINGRGGESN